MTWRVEFDAQADKELDWLDPQHAKHILKFLSEKITGYEYLRRFGGP